MCFTELPGVVENIDLEHLLLLLLLNYVGVFYNLGIVAVIIRLHLLLRCFRGGSGTIVGREPSEMRNISSFFFFFKDTAGVFDRLVLSV